jgi:hypothetical protein
VAGPPGGLAVDLGERGEALGQAADDGERHRQSEHACPDSGLRVASNGDPDGDRVLERARVHPESRERGSMLTRPGDVLSCPKLEQQLELLGEQLSS